MRYTDIQIFLIKNLIVGHKMRRAFFLSKMLKDIEAIQIYILTFLTRL